MAALWKKVLEDNNAPAAKSTETNTVTVGEVLVQQQSVILLMAGAPRLPPPS